MDSYFDIKALPNPEIIQSAVITHLMQGLHNLLPRYAGQIGLDFPAYGQQRTLGGIIRVLGNKNDIHSLYSQLQTSLDFVDYALLTELHEVPTQLKKHATYIRYHTKGNSRLKRLKKRHEERGTWTEELAEGASNKFNARINLPHVSLHSESTGQSFILFVKQHLHSEPQQGKFNAYGLSLENATVPKF